MITAKLLNKQSQSADKEWTSSFIAVEETSHCNILPRVLVTIDPGLDRRVNLLDIHKP